MTPRLLLVLILGLDAAVLLQEASSLSLTYHGARLLYDDGLLPWILHGSLALFGQNDVALRLPLIVMTLLNTLLLYRLSIPYSKSARERLWLVTVFILLPGTISGALLVNRAGLILLLLLIYLLARRRFDTHADWLLLIYLLADPAFAVLDGALALYYLKHADRQRAWIMAALTAASLFIHGFDTGGVPQGRFLDTLGIYAMLFSPIIFVYLVYTLYRRWVTATHDDPIWFIAVTALAASLLIAFRQHVALEFFVPFLMPALVLGMQTFAHSYRVRLRPFRRRYRLLFSLAVATVALHAVAVLFNKQLYPYLDDPTRHFAYRAQVAKELGSVLQQRGWTCLRVADDAALQLRLRFYGIEACDRPYLRRAGALEPPDVTIRYNNSIVAAYIVTNFPTEPPNSPLLRR